MNAATRERLRKLIDQTVRQRIARAHGKATEAELRMWREADRLERQQGGGAA